MDVVEALTALGGVATRAALIAATSRAAVDSSLRAGAITRHARGRYALASADEALTIAHALSGTLCLTSAALHHGWAVKHVPPEPHVSVPRGRKVPATRRAGAQLHRHDLADDDIVGGATSKEATLLHCLRSLPFDEALCVADSAARAGELALLSRVARIARGRGRRPDPARRRARQSRCCQPVRELSARDRPRGARSRCHASGLDHVHIARGPTRPRRP